MILALVGERVKIKEWFVAEQGRFILWVPIFLIVGISTYFQLVKEPSWKMTMAVLTGAVMVFWGGYVARATWVRHIGLILITIMTGFMLAQFRTSTVDAPFLHRTTAPMWIEGKVIDVEHRPRSERILIAPSEIEAISVDQLPHFIRITWRGDVSELRPGDTTRVKAVLSPPPQPVSPGGFHYGRQLFFEQIGALGYARTRPRVTARPAKIPLQARIDIWRDKVATRIVRSARSDAGPVLAAIVTGRREGIDPAITDQLRDTGLAHLLAISGLHMGLVCGGLFFALRFLLVLNEAWALRFPVKKWAAVGALSGGVIYLVLSGGAWSAQRAFIMAAISFIAILFDRRAISLRNVAIAAMIILTLRPEAVLSAGFHMSFAAVMALIAAYDFWRDRKQDTDLNPGGIARFLGGLSSTSLIAGLATSPFAIFHFNRIATFGFIANLLVMPIFSIAVMPLAMVGLALMPIGLDGWVWRGAAHAFDAIIWITHQISQWPYAVQLVPQWSDAGFALSILGMVVLCILKSPLRFLGLLFLLASMVMNKVHRVPIILVSEEANNVAVRMTEDEKTTLSLYSRRKDRFSVERWLEDLGVSSALKDLPKFGECKEDYCAVFTRNELIVAVSDSLEGTLLACREAQLVIAQIWNERFDRTTCQATLFTRADLVRHGPIAVYNMDPLSFRSVKQEGESRPWTIRP